jgi:hypothetical protein
MLVHLFINLTYTLLEAVEAFVEGLTDALD